MPVKSRHKQCIGRVVRKDGKGEWPRGEAGQSDCSAVPVNRCSVLRNLGKLLCR